MRTPPEDGLLTYEECLAEGYTLWTYDDFAQAVGMQPQSLRKRMTTRNRNIRADAHRRGVPEAQGRAQPDDIPAPLCYRPRPTPAPGSVASAVLYWDAEVATRWGCQVGKIKKGKPVQKYPGTVFKPSHRSAAA